MRVVWAWRGGSTGSRWVGERHKSSQLHSLGAVQAVLPHRQLVGQADVVVVAAVRVRGRVASKWGTWVCRRQALVVHASAAHPPTHPIPLSPRRRVCSPAVREGVSVHKHDVHVGAALRDAAKQLRRLQQVKGRGLGGGWVEGVRSTCRQAVHPTHIEEQLRPAVCRRTCVSCELCSARARCFCSSTTCAAWPASSASSSRCSGESALRRKHAHGAGQGGGGRTARGRMGARPPSTCWRARPPAPRPAPPRAHSSGCRPSAAAAGSTDRPRISVPNSTPAGGAAAVGCEGTRVCEAAAQQPAHAAWPTQPSLLPCPPALRAPPGSAHPWRRPAGAGRRATWWPWPAQRTCPWPCRSGPGGGER